MAKLGEVCLINPKSCALRDDTEVSFVPMTKVGERGEFDASEIKHYSEVKKGFTNFQNDDILFAKITPCMENGKGAIAQNMKNGVGFGSTEFHVLRPDTDKITSEWLYYLTTWKTFRKEAERNMTGSAGQKRVPKTFLENYVVNLPDIDTQKSENKILRKVDDLIFLHKQQLAKLDELVKARFVEMFGDPVKNTMDWEMKPLSELGELNRGVSKARPRNSPELLGGPYPLIQTGEVANAKTYITSFNSTYSEKGLAQSKMWPKGTLCITIAANIAQTSILTFDACFPDSVVGFISRNMTNELFIHYWFSFFQKILDEQAPQVAQKNINLKILSELNVIVPPLSLQNRFAAFVERVDQQKQTVQQSLEKLELMKKALMQEYFG